MSVMPLSACATQTFHKNGDYDGGIISTSHHHHLCSTHDPTTIHHLGKQYDSENYDKSIKPITTEHAQELSDHALTNGSSDSASSTWMDDESLPYQNTVTTSSPNKDLPRGHNNKNGTDYLGLASTPPPPPAMPTSSFLTTFTTATHTTALLEDDPFNLDLSSTNTAMQDIHFPAHLDPPETSDDDYYHQYHRPSITSGTSTNNIPVFRTSSQRSPSLISNGIMATPTAIVAIHSATHSSGVTSTTTTTTDTESGASKMDLGQLNDGDKTILETEIAAKRAPQRTRRRQHYADTDDEEDHLQIGTRVAEGHRNYQLMYDMLTGIRIAVGRVSAKMRRDPNKDDFTAAHKLVFDVTGNELTPGVKYDFKFKDYAPWVFRHLREIFHIDAADYLMSLTHKYILSELGSPGKSGSFFYYSRDYRFIIKTIHRSEHVFMRNILLDYYNHVKRNPNTLLCRIYGLHRIKLPRGRKIHFVVMGNVFPSNKNVHEIYDLKGSTFGRLTPEDELDKNPGAVMKDLNWVKREKLLELGPEKCHLLISQLEKDIDVLTRLNIMDYSLLIGIHGIEKGNDERFRDQRLQLIETRHLGTEHTPSKQQKFKAVKYTAVPLVTDSQLSTTPSQERRHCVFYADNGGFQSSDANDQDSDFLYYIGVIDILTPYNAMKKTEHIWKSITQDKNTISSVPPKLYGQRFLDFMKKAIQNYHT